MIKVMYRAAIRSTRKLVRISKVKKNNNKINKLIKKEKEKKKGDV